jgi:hypothetical protein
MAVGEDDAARAHGQNAGAAGQEYLYGWGLALESKSLLRGRQAAPPWMRAELVRLQAAFPEFSFGICPGWRGPMFEVWRETGTGGLYAVITSDARELWRELAASRAERWPVTDTAGKHPR